MISNRLAVSLFAALLVSAGPAAFKASAAPVPSLALGQDGWDAPPREFNEIQRRGFHDGIEGARKDFDNHRRPDVNNREEYRHPDDVPGRLRRAYQDAFRRGYMEGASHLWRGQGSQAPPPQIPPPVAGGGDWDRWGMRGLENDAARRGYRDGVEEARRDIQTHQRLDPDDQPQFRNPPTPPQLADEYREGFMRGYEVATSQLNGEGAWQNSGDPTSWAPPGRFSEMQRRGFHDGVEGANKDFGNHRRPNVANRDEYRDPRVPPALVREYREGFRRGYEMAAARLWGGGGY